MDALRGIRTPAQWVLLTFGVVYLLIGVAGYVGPLTEADPAGESLLFGAFAVDNVHNVVHLIIGIAAVVAAVRIDAARWTSRVLGVVILGVALWGFGLVGATGEATEMLGGMFHVNVADNWLHLASSALLLVLGFAPYGWRERAPMARGTEYGAR